MENIKNKTFKKICTCGQKLIHNHGPKVAFLAGMGLGTLGIISGASKMAQENKGKPLMSVTNVPPGHEGDMNGGTLLTITSLLLTGASVAGLRKITKDQSR